MKVPSGEILARNMSEDYLTLKNFEEELQIKLDQINVIEYQMQSDTLSYDGTYKNRFWIMASIRLRGGVKKHLFQMNSIALFSFDEEKHKERLKESAKQLTFLIAQHLETECRWKGEKKIK